MAGWASGLAGWPRGGTYVRTDVRTDERKISPFYRTSSPIGAAALPPPMKTKEKVEQGKGTADHLMPLGYFFFLDSLLTKSVKSESSCNEFPPLTSNFFGPLVYLALPETSFDLSLQTNR